SEQVELEFD
nr:Chain P, Nonapeptide from polymerase III C-terminal [synthetic construct]3D1F_Q Chain Q, Nonapeptide from polymerase III C-terminal [synthetic construct]